MGKRHKLKKQKSFKGSIFDLPFIIIALTIFVMITIVAFKVATGIQASIDASGNSGLTSVADPIFTNVFVGLQILADSAILVYVSFNFIAIIAAYFVKSHPVFAFVAILVLLVEVLIANVASNVVSVIFNNSALSTIANTNMSLSITLFGFLPFATFIIGIVLIIVQYGKPLNT